MRILHLLSGRCSLESPNGVDKTVYFLTRTQAEAGETLAVFGLSDKPVKEIPGVEVRNFSPSPNPFAITPALRDAVTRWRPDFIHLHSAYQIPNLPISRLARSLRVPYAVTAHGNLSPGLLRRKPLLKLPYKLLFERPFFNRAAFVHAIADMDDIRAYGVRRPIVVAANGFDLCDLPQPLDPRLALERFPRLAGKEMVLYLGRLDTRQKGLDLLLEAFAQAAADRKNLHLALAGPDWKGSLPRLQAQAESFGLADAVTFCGPVTGPDKYHLMSAARFFVHPSRWEAGIPFSVLEALATGTPCLLSPQADPSRLTENHHAGIVAASEPAELAAAIGRLADLPPASLAAMSENARALIQKEFPWQKTAETLIAAYRQFAQPA